MSDSSGSQILGRRRLLLLLMGAVLWTAASCYPNPLVLARNLQRYHRAPVDPQLEQKMGWELSPRPADIELFVDSLLVPTPDWRLYRVPWYVPTAAEAAQSLHGDCEAKAFLLASLLAGKGIPYEFRASFNHIWVDYPGRSARPGESAEVAYLSGESGRLRLRWPDRVAWRKFFVVQREQLWGTMPLARKALWLIGLAWSCLAALVLGGVEVKGELASRRRVRGRDCISRTVWSALGIFIAVVLAAGLFPRSGLPRWTYADLWEIVALSAFCGAFVTWLSTVSRSRAVTVAEDGSHLVLAYSLGLWQGSQQLEVAKVAHIELETSPGGLRPWTISAALRTGRRLPLLHCRDELPARSALRRLGRALDRPLLVRSDGNSFWTMPDEIELNLLGRLARRPVAPTPAQPKGCLLEVKDLGDRWRLSHPAADRGSALALLGFASIPAIFLALATLAVLNFPVHALVWVVWMLAASLLSVTVYLAILLRSEIIGVLAGAHLEIAQGELRFHTPEGRAESVELSQIDSIELARRGEDPTIAIVSPDRVVHLRGLCPSEHRKWLAKTIERAVTTAAGRREKRSDVSER